MQRDIKFRAWDVIEGKMWEPIVAPDGVLMASNQIGGWVTFPANQDPLMQYTGLKDKNGVEIYESDLIKSSRTSLIYQIVWLGGSEWSGENNAEFVGLCVDPEKDFRLSPYAWDEAEVIGNIYENPELLQGGK